MSCFVSEIRVMIQNLGQCGDLEGLGSYECFSCRLIGNIIMKTYVFEFITPKRTLKAAYMYIEYTGRRDD